MIFKLCYQNEIHRCSSPPKDFSDLQALLIKTFRTELPQEYTVNYSIPGGDENVLLMTQEDYETLLSKNPANAVKIFIREKKEALKDQERIIDLDLSEEKKVQKDEEEPKRDPNLESFVEILAEDVIVPQVQKYPYFSHNEVKDDHIRKIVREALKDQMPFIISQVKDALLKELQPSLPPVQKIEEEIPKDVGSQCYLQDNSQEVEDLIEKPEPRKSDQNPFVTKVKNLGKNIKDRIVEFPGKAKNAIDDWSQKLEGDPLVQCEEGKYPRSVVEKAAELNEIFPEEERKNLLELVNRCPRYATITQLADYYIRKNEPQEVEKVDENDENVAEEDNQKENQYAC